jgi:hypothetical protein
MRRTDTDGIVFWAQEVGTWPRRTEARASMARRLIPSSFECDCGHQIHFFERTVREMEAGSRRSRKPQVIVDSDDDKHRVEFIAGQATAVICPELGRCEITGWA